MDWDAIVKDCVQGGNDKVATLSCIPAVFQNVVKAALIFAGAAAVFFIIFSGIKFITSGGDPKKIEAARHTIMYAILGLLIILFSFLIINLIGFVTGANCITIFGFNSCGS